MFLQYTKESRHHFLLFFTWLALPRRQLSWLLALLLCCLCPSACFNDFQFLVNVLLNVNIAVIPYMPCFLLRIVLYSKWSLPLFLVPGLRLLWTHGLAKTTHTITDFSVNDNVSFLFSSGIGPNYSKLNMNFWLI